MNFKIQRFPQIFLFKLVQHIHIFNIYDIKIKNILIPTYN